MPLEPLDYLKSLESHGFSCYIVGGYVRDRELGIDSTDIDIATSARPEDITRIFNVSTTDNLGCVNIVNEKYNIDITTYRRESSYENRHPQTIEYIEDIDEDLRRRDFTMNAICLKSDGTIYDPLGGMKDLSERLIRVIGKIDSKFKEDPLRMLRALRMSIIYGFAIEKAALDYIIENKTMIKNLSFDRKKSEIDKILLSGQAESGLRYLEKLGLLEVLEIAPLHPYKEIPDSIGAWAQLRCDRYPFSKSEIIHMTNIRSIIETGVIDEDSIYLYGIGDNLIAAKILGIDAATVESLYENMPIHGEDDLVLDGQDIMGILGIESSPLIRKIKKDLISEVLSGNLPNSEAELSNYIKENWK